jgi:hypothetical protein
MATMVQILFLVPQPLLEGVAVVLIAHRQVKMVVPEAAAVLTGLM